MIDPAAPSNMRKAGWAAWNDLMEWSMEAVESNESIFVHGAGTDFVNGLYRPTTIDGDLGYVRIVPEGFGTMSGTRLTIARCMQCPGLGSQYAETVSPLVPETVRRQAGLGGKDQVDRKRTFDDEAPWH